MYQTKPLSAPSYRPIHHSSWTSQPWNQEEPVTSYEQFRPAQKWPPQSLHSNNSYTGLSGEPEDIALVDQPATLHPPRPSSHRRSPFFRWWIPELLSSTISLVALAILIVLLRVYDGRPLNDLRLPSWLTLNGLIAAIATINRVALVAPIEAAISQEAWLWFSSPRQRILLQSRLEDLEISDAASRGVWGSLMFMFRGKRRWVSYAGSLIVVVSLAFGAFTQQLISIENVAVAKASPSVSLPGNLPRSNTWISWTGNPAEDAWSTTLSMKAATYNGILAEDIAPAIASCSTGNCTWPLTPSLAVCGECHHVSYRTSCNATICNYTLPSGTEATILRNPFDAYSSLGFLTRSREPDYNGTSKRLNLAQFDVFGAPYDTYASQWTNGPITAAECAIWYCIHAYHVESHAGQQTQQIRGTFDQINHLLPSGGGFSGSDLFYFDALPPSLNPAEGANYSVGIFATMALQEFLSPLFDGNVTLNLESQSPSSDFVEAVWNGTANLDAWINNLAISMTNVVRTSTPVSDDIYNGTAFQQGIKVRWIWLILPCTMVATSSTILVVVMVKSARSNVEVWKGSPLTFLFSEVDPLLKEQVGASQLGTVKGIERAVGKRRAVLEWTDKGILRFRSAG